MIFSSSQGAALGCHSCPTRERDTVAKIGIIGTGSIGASLTRGLSRAGHVVTIANTRGPQSLAELAAESGATASALEDVGRDVDVDVLITSIPFRRMPELRTIVDRLPAGVPVADTSNYYPRRDGRIEEIERGEAEGVWLERQLGRPVVRAWNSLLQTTLADKGRPRGAADRLAVAVAGSDVVAKRLVMDLVDDTGFDPVDAGTAEDTWRLQAGAPAYCTELSAEQLRAALTLADRDAVTVRHSAVLSIIDTWEQGPTFFDDIVALYRAAAGLSAR
ncbi:3-hydroxyisobutyrate dehydrogenase [Cryptosporangium phraense]|uniref:3-hydroxyisobutyrate dehydrogenase n=2 Tax=Cryptosporangium phraense TaxID=2593070 RepID=A0A545AY62_9ACTN|nr:3-hydroxyisobutyrate dehydrogenase [Cryptosporangium phraense]